MPSSWAVKTMGPEPIAKGSSLLNLPRSSIFWNPSTAHELLQVAYPSGPLACAPSWAVPSADITTVWPAEREMASTLVVPSPSPAPSNGMVAAGTYTVASSFPGMGCPLTEEMENFNTCFPSVR